MRLRRCCPIAPLLALPQAAGIVATCKDDTTPRRTCYAARLRPRIAALCPSASPGVEYLAALGFGVDGNGWLTHGRHFCVVQTMGYTMQPRCGSRIHAVEIKTRRIFRQDKQDKQDKKKATLRVGGKALFKAVVVEGKARCFIFSASRRKGPAGRRRSPECCCDDRVPFW